MILQDIPLNSLSDDEFGRRPLVDIVTKSILELCSSEHECVIYGIFGKWGEGKTSFMHFVKGSLIQEGADSSIHTSSFNPWLLNNEESILKEFFLNISTNFTDDIKKQIVRYGDWVSMMSRIVLNTVLPGSGEAVSLFVDNAKKAINSSEGTICEQKEKVSESIARSGKHSVIFIDDIDRLDKEEIHTLFRLIRQVADFKNTVYVVAMDFDIVSKSLGTYFGAGGIEDGRRFIEKIVNVPILLPTIPEKLLKASLRKDLFSILSDNNADCPNLDNLLNTICPLFMTRRGIIRYINQLRFVLPSLSNEVNLDDLCIVEAIKTRNPQAYLLIRDNKTALLKIHKSFVPDSIEATKKINEDFDKAIETIGGCFDNTEKTTIETILNTLFGHSESFAIDDEKSIQSKLFFPVYFSQSVPDEIMPNSVTKELMVNWGRWTVDDIVVWVNNAFKLFGENEVERAMRIVLNSLELCRRSDFACIFAKALAFSDMAKNYGYDFFHYPTGTWATVTSFLINRYVFLSQQDSDKVKDIFISVFQNAEIHFCMVLNSNIHYEMYFTDKDIVYSCIAILVRRFITLTRIEQLKFSTLILFALFDQWKKCDPHSYDDYTVKLLSDASIDYLHILKTFIDGTDDEKDVINFIQYFDTALPFLDKRIKDDSRKEAYTRERMLYVDTRDRAVHNQET